MNSLRSNETVSGLKNCNAFAQVPVETATEEIIRVSRGNDQTVTLVISGVTEAEYACSGLKDC